MPTVTARRVDWFKNPASSPGLASHLELSGGPIGYGENAVRFDLGTTAAFQRAAYSNLRLGGLRGAGRLSVSSRRTVDADRTQVDVLARWNPARLDDLASAYAAGLRYAVVRTVGDGACSVGANTKITSATAAFDANDLGRSIDLTGAGVAGTEYVGAVTNVDSPTQVTVSPAISTTVANKVLTLADHVCSLRQGPAEGGVVLFSRRLNALFGFVRDQWIEVALDLTLDTVGNLKMLVLVRPNPRRGVVVPYATFRVDSDSWYQVDRAVVPRHLVRGSGESGWQILTRAGAGSVRIGDFRAKVGATIPLTLLPDVVVL